MGCAFPFELPCGVVPCGKCQGCLRKRRKEWVCRMQLEAKYHLETSFVTLTYETEHLPIVYHEETDQWLPTLVKSHCQTFLKSLKRKLKRLEYPDLRYFLAGEYGTKSLRPHYHAIMFGVGAAWQENMRNLWGRGFVSAYPATPATMAYVAKYILKGSQDGESHLATSNPHLDQRVTTPPFRLMSQRPALGGTAAKDIIRSMVGVPQECLLTSTAGTLRIDGKRMPMAKTLRNYLEKEFQEQYNPTPGIAEQIFRNRYEPTEEDQAKAFGAHRKALDIRGTKTKL